MATLYVSYFGSVQKGVAGDPVKTETVTTSGTSAATAAIPKSALVAAVHSDAAHYVTIGEGTPTAAITNGFYLPANVTREFIVPPNVTVKIAAVTV